MKELACLPVRDGGHSGARTRGSSGSEEMHETGSVDQTNKLGPHGDKMDKIR